MKNLCLLFLITLLTGCAAYYRLINAIEDGDIEVFSELVGREDVKVNHQVMSGESLLHTALRYNRLEMVDSLLNRGANPFALNARVESPFLLMLWEMRPEMLELIHKYTIDINISNEKNRNFYFLIIDKFHEELEAHKENLIKYKILKEEFKNELDTTIVLRYDLELDSLQTRMSFSFQHLLDFGLNINATDDFQNTPFLYAAKQNEIALISFINSILPDKNKIKLKNVVNGAASCLTPSVFSALSKSLHHNHIDINHNDIEGNNALLCSALVSKSLVQILTMLGSDPYIKNFNGEGLTFKSVEGGHIELLKYSIDNLGNDINELDNAGNNLLHVSSHGYDIYNKSALIEIIPIFGTNTNTMNPFERSEERLSIFSYLVEKGININQQNNNKETPLILFIKNNLTQMAVELLKHNPDLSCADSNEMKAIDYAKKNKLNKIIEKLE
ncbi:MAG: ankyrin repeat domain-containing protein [Bacteroidetes bacterium]|nr:ankyrin repeat domain-containing protein [Bacteroidota bacterium]